MALSDETPGVWFVELSSPPAVEGTSLLTLARREAGVSPTQRLERGFASPSATRSTPSGMACRSRSNSNAGRMLGRMPGVTAVYPVVTIDAPEPPTRARAPISIRRWR